MPRILALFAASLIILLLPGCGGSCCGGSSGGSSQTPVSLKLTKLSSSEELPAVVTVSFKVETDSGLPVPNLDVDTNFTLKENEQEISQFESTPKIAPEPNEFVYSTILLLDLSGSILLNSLDTLKTASKGLIDQIIPSPDPGNFQMKIAYFDGNAGITELTGFLSDRTMLKDTIDLIDENTSTDSSTNLYGAVVEGINQIDVKVTAEQQADVLSAGALIIFTDGSDRAGRVTEDAAINSVNNADEKIAVFTIGLEGEIDTNVLDQLGREGFQQASGLSGLSDSFSNIAQLTNDEANSFYILKYCSPRRSGFNNKLEIIASFNGASGSLIHDFSASSFTGGCQI